MLLKKRFPSPTDSTAEDAAPLLSCSACAVRTTALQSASLLAAAGWLEHCARTRDLDKLESPPPLALSRWQPDCAWLACEAPVRREARVRDRATELVQNLFWERLQVDSRVQESLLRMAVSWAAHLVHVSRRYRFAIGPVSFHALVVANNLVHAAALGDNVPSVDPNRLDRACAPSLDAMERVLAEKGVPRLEAGDVVVVHLLNRGVRRALEAARSFEPEKPPPRRRSYRGALFLVGGIFACSAAVFGFAQQTLVAALVAAAWFLALLTSAVLAFRSQRRFAVPETTWQERLSASHRAEREALANQFDRCDALKAAATLFENTVCGAEDSGAGLLVRLQPVEGGRPVLSWILKVAAEYALRPLTEGPASAERGRLAKIVAALLESTDQSAGAYVVALFLTSVLHAARGVDEPKEDGEAWPAEGSRLWGLLAGSPLPLEPRAANNKTGAAAAADPDFPLLLARFFAHVARDRDEAEAWSDDENDVNNWARTLADELFFRPPLRDESWHLLLVRFLWHVLDRQRWFAFPLGSRGSWITLCATVKDIGLAYGLNEAAEPSGTAAEVAAVMRLPGFLGRPEDGEAGDGSRWMPRVRPARQPAAIDEAIAACLPMQW